MLILTTSFTVLYVQLFHYLLYRQSFTYTRWYTFLSLTHPYWWAFHEFFWMFSVSVESEWFSSMLITYLFHEPCTQTPLSSSQYAPCQIVLFSTRDTGYHLIRLLLLLPPLMFCLAWTSSIHFCSAWFILHSWPLLPYMGTAMHHVYLLVISILDVEQILWISSQS